jgi:hypothetical protein
MTFRTAYSGVRHALRSHALKRRFYPRQLAEFPHLRIIRITSSEQMTRWLEGIADVRTR